MRLAVQVQTTLDGYMAGIDDDMSWMTQPWSEDLEQYTAELTERVDTIVLGRRLAEGFIPTWASMPEAPGAHTFNTSRRLVVSRSLAGEPSPWENAEIVDSLDAVRALKSEAADDDRLVIAYGGGELLRSLIAEGLVDELHLFVNPVSIGAGMPVFPEGRHDFRVREARSFECGVAVLQYAPASA